MNNLFYALRESFSFLSVQTSKQQKDLGKGLPWGAVVKIPCFQCRGTSSIPGLGTKMLHSMAKKNPKKQQKKP